VKERILIHVHGYLPGESGLNSPGYNAIRMEMVEQSFYRAANK